MKDAKLLIFFPIFSIFFTGIFFPVKGIPYKPVFQPPNQFFGIAWTYITLSFGYISYKYYTIYIVRSERKNLLTHYLFILFLLNFWLVLNSFQYYKLAFWELLISSYVSILYLLFLVNNSKTKEVTKYTYFLLPLSFWLILASCLNGVIYDHVSS
jgi:tryptophan-rich sensory protein